MNSNVKSRLCWVLMVLLGAVSVQAACSWHTVTIRTMKGTHPTSGSSTTWDRQVGYWVCDGFGIPQFSGNYMAFTYNPTWDYGHVLHQADWNLRVEQADNYVNYRINGAGSWIDGVVVWVSPTLMEVWVGGPPPPKVGQVCVTNTSWNPAVYEILFVASNWSEQRVLAPGHSFCVEAIDEHFRVNILEMLPDFTGTNSGLIKKPIFEWDPATDGSTNVTMISTNPTVRPLPTTSGVFDNPTNDTQLAANAAAAGDQAGRENDDRNTGILAGILTGIGEGIDAIKRAIYGQADRDTEGEEEGKSQVQSNTQTLSNELAGAWHSSTGGLLSVYGSLYSSSPGSASPGAAVMVDIPTSAHSWSFDINPVNALPEMGGFATFSRMMLLLLAKVFAVLWMLKNLRTQMADFASVMKGNGTSGWLQAFLVSMPNLGTSLWGLLARWRVMWIFLPLIWAFFTGAIASIGDMGDSPLSMASVVPEDPFLLRGWQWLLMFVPVVDIMRIAITAVTGVFAMQFFVFGASIVSDGTSKA